MEWDSLDEAALSDLAAKVAEVLRPGDTVVLSGEVGSGKTTFVRAAARALGVKERVTSPTYQLARGYKGSSGGGIVTVNHLDLYRIEEVGDRDALELDDYLDPHAITFIEWAEPALKVLENPSVLRLSHQTPTTRRADLRGPVAGRLSRC
ncbi:MAG TPA: tRNA (adenosine(37)-N6)-threonylcarbamoyltransferase complex ATPase subunit type 1 TsaE [Rubrobacteraceae bacterium]|nr:tRNA (adenosine(37)-N6)-threonylcarbamoyltransferase complex ATPase subunit type 1 TsaE [Rubrobacteraceae bacterium]